MKAGFLEAIRNGGDFSQGHSGAAVGGDNFNLFEFIGPLPPFFQPQQHLAGIRFDGTGWHVFAGAADQARHLAQCQPVFAQSVLGDFNVGHVVRCIAQFHLGDRQDLRDKRSRSCSASVLSVQISTGP